MPRIPINRVGSVDAQGQNGPDIPFAGTESWVLVSPAVWAWIIRALIASGALTAGGGGVAWWMSDDSTPPPAPAAQVQNVRPGQAQAAPVLQVQPAAQQPPAQPPIIIQPMVVQPVVVPPVVIQPQPVQQVQRAPAQPTPTGPPSIWNSPANR